MNIKHKNRAIIISSPSGAGKTTLCKLLLKKMKNIDLSISYTTRNQRLNEINGKDYKFVTKKQFIELKNKNYFIETALNFGNYYGSPFKNFSSSERNKKDILFDIDWKGARKIRKKIEKNKILDFFILPPSIKELKNRLIKRGRDNKNDTNFKRLIQQSSFYTFIRPYVKSNIIPLFKPTLYKKEELFKALSLLEMIATENSEANFFVYLIPRYEHYLDSQIYNINITIYKEICDELKIRCEDVSEIFSGHDNVEKFYILNDGHLSSIGSTLVADHLYQLLTN